MQNPIFDKLVTQLTPLLGPPRPLVNKSGTRFLRNGSVTVYHTEVAEGNQAELAFNIQPVSSKFGISPQALNDLIMECQVMTGCEVEVNKQQDWPRIGIASDEHLDVVVKKLLALRK